MSLWILSVSARCLLFLESYWLCQILIFSAEICFFCRNHTVSAGAGILFYPQESYCFCRILVISEEIFLLLPDSCCFAGILLFPQESYLYLRNYNYFFSRSRNLIFSAGIIFFLQDSCCFWRNIFVSARFILIIVIVSAEIILLLQDSCFFALILLFLVESDLFKFLIVSARLALSLQVSHGFSKNLIAGILQTHLLQISVGVLLFPVVSVLFQDSCCCCCSLIVSAGMVFTIFQKKGKR